VPIRKGDAAKGKQQQRPPPEQQEAPPPPPLVPSVPAATGRRRGLNETAVDLLCGAAAEATQLATLYPLDTLKVRCQLSRAPPLAELRTILAGGAGRFRELYAGCVPAALGASLFGGLYMLAYQSFYRRNLRLMGADPDRALVPAGNGGNAAVAEEEEEWQGPPLAALSMAAALSAMMANCCTAVVEVPLDTARQRLQAGVASGSMVHTMRVAAAAGPRVLYAGFVPFLLRTIPLDALQFCVYEALQSVRERTEASSTAAADARGVTAPPPMLTEAVTDMLLGGIAGGVSAFLTMPLDTIKTHINCGPRGLGVVSAARMIWAASGPRGFFAGTSSRLLERVPSCAVYWLAAEATRRVLSPEEEGASVGAAGAAAA
jgi:solute carrier family 25 S-adenosylmethionine transporter 26